MSDIDGSFLEIDWEARLQPRCGNRVCQMEEILEPSVVAVLQRQQELAQHEYLLWRENNELAATLNGLVEDLPDHSVSDADIIKRIKEIEGPIKDHKDVIQSQRERSLRLTMQQPSKDMQNEAYLEKFEDHIGAGQGFKATQMSGPAVEYAYGDCGVTSWWRRDEPRMQCWKCGCGTLTEVPSKQWVAHDQVAGALS